MTERPGTGQVLSKVAGAPLAGSNVHRIQDLMDLVTTKTPITDLKQCGGGLTDDVKVAKATDKHEGIVGCIVDHCMPAKKKADWQFRARQLGHGPEEDLWVPWKEAYPLVALDAYKADHLELGL